ncbi:MAG: hypothetical protein U0414_21005 [Polyangiaceae bacterium]
MGRTPARSSTVLAAFLLLACGAAPREAPPAALEPPARSASPRTDTAAYEVHEWGLLRAEAGDVLNAGVVAPPNYHLMDVGKPVLYFHAAAAMRLTSVRVRTPLGSIVESWPSTGIGNGAEVTWTGVALGPNSDCAVSKLPTTAEPPCSLLAPGTQCETAGLAAVRTEDASCVTSGATTERFLFYRAQAKFTPPLRFTRETGDVVEVENDGDLPIPGILIRVSGDGQRTRSTVAIPPAPHAKVRVGRAPSTDADVDAPSDRRGRALGPAVGPGLEALRMTLGDLGMTSDETDAFMGAWTETLFSGTGAADDEADARLSQSDSFIYFLPVQAIDAIATLELDPPPRVVKRAFAIWSSVRASGSGR